MAVALLWLMLLSTHAISYALLKPLESRYESVEKIDKDIGYILILGGVKERRSWEALRLYHALDGAKIVTSGYKGAQNESEAKLTAKMLIQAGVKKEDILLHVRPTNTKAEAMAMKKRIGERAVYLVTSAYHMSRAMALFTNEGLHPIPAPTDFIINPYKRDIYTPNVQALQESTIAFHEYLGLLWGKLRGTIA